MKELTYDGGILHEVKFEIGDLFRFQQYPSFSNLFFYIPKLSKKTNYDEKMYKELN